VSEGLNDVACGGAVDVGEFAIRLSDAIGRKRRLLASRRWYKPWTWLPGLDMIHADLMLGVNLAFAEHLALPYATGDQRAELERLVLVGKDLTGGEGLT
jgi:hypothetical protein